MQRSIGAAVERLAVDLYASRWDGTPLRLCPLCPLTFKENTGIHWKLARVWQGALPARTHSESWKKLRGRVMVVLCCSDSQFFKSEAIGPRFHLTVYLLVIKSLLTCRGMLMTTATHREMTLSPSAEDIIRALKLMACDGTSA